MDRRLRLETRGRLHQTRSEPQMQEVVCVASPGGLLLRLCLYPDQESMAEGAGGGAMLEALPGGGPAWWRPCLVEALPGGGPAWWRPCLVEALPGGGCLSWGRWSLTLK
ncbi:unnamed protein product [Boreogadus saida]